MNYEEAREYIQSLTPRGIVPGLTTVRRLCEELGNPQNGLCYIHIAGTNGKGSTGAFLGSILKAAGRKTARFVSPSVGDYLEAFTIDETPIDGELYAACAKKVCEAVTRLEAEGIYPTSFEAETAVAFLAFSRLAPDYVLLECGMGGRLDATNIITSPYASVITSVSTDHTKFLGSTLAEIASEKCGIIKHRCPVVTCSQPDEVMEVIAEAAKAQDAPLFIADSLDNIRINGNETEFIYYGDNYRISMPGTYQPQNAALAVQTAQILGISQCRIYEGLAAAKWRCRFERIGKYIIDGAHNEGAALALAASIKQYVSGRTAYICGCFKDKDYMKIAEITAPYADTVYCITPPTERGLASTALADAFNIAGARAIDAETMQNAFALADAEDYDNIIIFGSLSISAEARRIAEGKTTDEQIK